MATVSFTSPGEAPLELPLRQFDAEQFIAMADAGVFAERRRVELIGGYVVDMSPAESDHNYFVMRLNRLLLPVWNRFDVWIQGTLRVDRRHVFDPDVMLLRPRTKSYREALPSPADVALAIEVSASSLEHDVRVKRPLYAKAGVGELWIVDIERETVIVHRRPRGGDYSEVRELTGDASLSPAEAADFGFTVRELFA